LIKYFVSGWLYKLATKLQFFQDVIFRKKVLARKIFITTKQQRRFVSIVLQYSLILGKRRLFYDGGLAAEDSKSRVIFMKRFFSLLLILDTDPKKRTYTWKAKQGKQPLKLELLNASLSPCPRFVFLKFILSITSVLEFWKWRRCGGLVIFSSCLWLWSNNMCFLKRKKVLFIYFFIVLIDWY